MQNKHLCVFIHKMRLAHREIGLSIPVNFFNDRSKAVLLLLIICVIYVLCCHAFPSDHCCLVFT